MPTSKRDVADDVAEVSASKQQRTSTEQTATARPETTQEPPTTRTRITAVTVTTKKGQEIKALSNEDEQEATTEKILLEPWVKNAEGLNREQALEGMKQEIRSMKAQQVYTEVSFSNLTKAQSKVIKSRWVLRQKGNRVRARIMAKGYTEEVNDNDDIYASTPIFCVRLLLTLTLTFNWIVRTVDISTAFLHAKAATEDLFMFPPTEVYNPEDHIVWKLNKAIYGLRSSPKAWQKHLAETPQKLGMQRLTSEPNAFKTATGNAFILVYVDDLLFLGEPTVVNKPFADIQQQLLLRPTGDLTVGNSVNFVGRNISNKGDYYETSLATTYTTELLKEASMLNCNASPAPGTKTTSTDVEQPLTTEEHKAYRRAVGKLQSVTYTRPGISYATKELARSLTQTTTLDQQKLKHLQVDQGNTALQVLRETNCQNNGSDTGPQRLRGLGLGTMRYNTGSQHQVSSSSSWDQQSCRQPHTSNHRPQALRSAEAELYAINTGATESLHIRNILQEALNIKKVNIRIHTNSSSGKSMATGNKDWILKESKAHRAQTPFHPTIGAARSREDHQDQHSEQRRGHLHQVRGHRDALEASQRCWAHKPALLATAATNNSFTAASVLTRESAYTCEHRA